MKHDTNRERLASPHNIDSDSLLQKPEIDHAQTKIVRERRVGGGVLLTTHVTMLRSGLRYVVDSGEPDFRTTDTPMSEKTPWGTSNRFGLDDMMYMMSLGVPSDVVSAEQNIAGVSLDQSARNWLAINEYTAQTYERDQKALIVSGASRGALTGLVLNDVANKEKVHIIHSDLRAPPYPNGFRLADTAGYSAGPLHEIATLPKMAMSAWRSAERSPLALARNIRAVPHIIGGDAGRAVERIPKTMSATISIYEGDVLGQGDIWEEKFADFPNVAVRRVDGGGHFSLASREERTEWRKRMDELSDKLPARRFGRTALNAV
jgi:hypothetical protein